APKAINRHKGAWQSCNGMTLPCSANKWLHAANGRLINCRAARQFTAQLLHIHGRLGKIMP
ncbi:MAG: hypothetical protein NTV22_04875, partial [bacterium]|nr:hypothetical protein [bacterium]